MPSISFALLGLANAAEPAQVLGEHFSRTLTSEDGLPATGTSSVDVDERGFLWVGSHGGVVRLDGDHTTRMTNPGMWVVRGSGAANRIVVSDGSSASELRGPYTLAPIALPMPPPYLADNLRIDHNGRLWVAGHGQIWVEDAAGVLVEVPFGRDEPRILGPDPAGGAIIEADGRLYRVTREGATDLGPSSGALFAVARGDGAVVTAINESPNNNQAAVLAHQDGEVKRLFSASDRILDVVADGRDLYFSTDRALYRIDPDDHLSTLGPPACCGWGVVDREGGLWYAGEIGLRHLPSPRTTTWRASSSIRMAAAPDGLWVSAWDGMHRYRHAGGDSLEITSWHVSAIMPCNDPRGDTWTVRKSAILRFDGVADPKELPGPGISGYYHGCASGLEGRTWLGSPYTLLVSDPKAPTPHRVPGPPPGIPDVTPGDLTAVAEADGMVLYGTRGSLCRAKVDRVLSEADAGWVCDTLPAPAEIFDIEVLGGEVWVSVRNLGVMRGSARDGGWRLLPESASLRTGTLGMLALSPRGGLWVLSEGQVLRVEGTPDGWKVLERIGAAQGVREDIRPFELVETDAIWLLTVDGAVTRVESQVRATDSAGPAVYLTQVSTAGGPVLDSAPLVLDAGEALELQFAAPVFGRRSQLSFRYRLRPEDPWSAPILDPTLRFAAIGAGSYQVEVAASLDGRNWTEPPAKLSYRVRAPWYLQAPFLFVCVAAAAGAGWFAQHLRMRATMRLERQRARIARDLHDEIGSGLGSIGILAGVAARRRGDPQSAELVDQIGRLVSDLGVGLTDIVTSLRGGAANLRSLHAHIVERGTGLCAGGQPLFIAAPSDQLPEVPLSVPVRINVFLIAAEAVHNAVRHAQAASISLRIERVGMRTWELALSDDGVGMQTPSKPGRVSGGVGLRSMRERADEIGATLSFAQPPSGGTVVRLRFDPAAEERS